MERTEERLQQIEQKLDDLLRILQETPRPTAPKTHYSVQEVAEIVGRSSFQVRCWCRDARIGAEKAWEGRGPHRGWRIPAEALTEYRNHGLRPPAGGTI